MPDLIYHGDLLDSSIPVCDRIQATLKCLIPNYQPILIPDSSILSDKSYQKQEQICAEFQQTCANIITTLKEMMQEEESSDPENLDPEKSDLENSSQINGVKFEVQHSDPTILDSMTNSSHHKTKRELDAVHQQVATAISISTPEKNIQAQSATIQNQIAESVDLHEELATEKRVKRPPRKPPDLHSHSGAFDDADHDASRNKSGGTEDITAEREEHTIAKAWVTGGAMEENSQDPWRWRDANEAWRSAEVGASARGMYTTRTVESGTRPRAVVVGGKCTTSTSRGAEDGAVATMTDRGRVTRLLRRFILLTPPPLLAAVFPWNRGAAATLEGDSDDATGNDNEGRQSWWGGEAAAGVVLGAPEVSELLTPVAEVIRVRLRSVEGGRLKLGTGGSSEEAATVKGECHHDFSQANNNDCVPWRVSVLGGTRRKNDEVAAADPLCKESEKGLLTPLLRLGHNQRFQAQVSMENNLSYLLLGNSKTMHADKLIYWAINDGLEYKQFDPGGNLMLLALE